MVCPDCGGKMRVIRTIRDANGATVTRIRECEECKRRVMTTEKTSQRLISC